MEFITLVNGVSRNLALKGNWSILLLLIAITMKEFCVWF